MQLPHSQSGAALMDDAAAADTSACAKIPIVGACVRAMRCVIRNSAAQREAELARACGVRYSRAAVEVRLRPESTARAAEVETAVQRCGSAADVAPCAARLPPAT